MARHCNPKAARRLIPCNWGVGVWGGAQFIFHTLVSECRRTVFMNDSSQYLLALDIQNMFNKVSRKHCREILVNDFPELAQIFD